MKKEAVCEILGSGISGHAYDQSNQWADRYQVWDEEAKTDLEDSAHDANVGEEEKLFYIFIPHLKVPPNYHYFLCNGPFVTLIYEYAGKIYLILKLLSVIFVSNKVLLSIKYEETNGWEKSWTY